MKGRARRSENGSKRDTYLGQTARKTHANRQRQIDGWTERQTDRQTGGQRGRRMERERDGQTGRLLTEQPRCSGFQNSLLGTLNDGFWQRERVSYHCAVQPVLRHNAASSPSLLRLAPLGSSVLEPHLHRHTAPLNSSHPHVHTQYNSIPSSSRFSVLCHRVC